MPQCYRNARSGSIVALVHVTICLCTHDEGFHVLKLMRWRAGCGSDAIQKGLGGTGMGSFPRFHLHIGVGAVQSVLPSVQEGFAGLIAIHLRKALLVYASNDMFLSHQ